MHAARLDRRVRKEAKELVREARAALSLAPPGKRGLRGKAGDLETVTNDVGKALDARDFQKVRYHLPVLDALVDELVKRPPKSTTRDYIESIGAAILIALALRAFVIEAFKIPSSSMYPTLEIGDHIFVNKFIYGVRIPYTSTKLFQFRGPKRGEVIVFMQPCTPEKDYIKRVVATENQTVEVRCNVIYIDGKAVKNELIEGDTCSYQDYPDGSDRWQTKLCSRYRETVDDLAYETFHEHERPEADRRTPLERLSGGSRDFPKIDLAMNLPSCRNQIETDAEGGAASNQLPGAIRETKPKEIADKCEPQLHYVVPPGHVFVMGDNRANSNDSRYWGSVPVENIKGKALFIWLSYAHWGLTDWSGMRWSRIGNFVH